MLFREIEPNEFDHVYKMGYREWAKGRTYEQYVKENQKEEENGTRFVLVNEKNKIMGSLIIIVYKIDLFGQTIPLYGLGSFVIEPDSRTMGYGKRMLKECMSSFDKGDDAIFILYCDINPRFYHPFQFKELPNELQRYANSICMVRAQEHLFREFCNLPISRIPAYF